MTRKTYTAIADAMVRTDASEATIYEVALVLYNNTNFDMEKWYEYVRKQQAARKVPA